MQTPITIVALFTFAKGILVTLLKTSIQQYNSTPAMPMPYINRGTAYSEKGEIDEAIKDYNTAIEINPREANAYYNRGTDILPKKRIRQSDKRL